MYHRHQVPGVSGEHTLMSMIKAVSPTTKVLLVIANIEPDTETGWADIDRCLRESFSIHDLLTAVRALLPSDVALYCGAS